MAKTKAKPKKSKEPKKSDLPRRLALLVLKEDDIPGALAMLDDHRLTDEIRMYLLDLYYNKRARAELTEEQDSALQDWWDLYAE